MLHKELVLYKKHKDTSKTCLNSARNISPSILSRKNVDIKLVDKIKLNKTTPTIFMSLMTWMIFLQLKVKGWISFSYTTLDSSRYFNKPIDI